MADKPNGSTVWKISNNFIHDTCTGTWFACVIVILTLVPMTPAMPAEAAAAIGVSVSRVWWLLLAALIGLAITGGIRLSYWRTQSTVDELGVKRRALIWKHIAFILIYGMGSAWMFVLVSR